MYAALKLQNLKPWSQVEGEGSVSKIHAQRAELQGCRLASTEADVWRARGRNSELRVTAIAATSCVGRLCLISWLTCATYDLLDGACGLWFVAPNPKEATCHAV